MTGARTTIFALASLLLPVSVFAQASVITQHNDAARTGANLAEITLTTTNVNVSEFGKLFERVVDDEIYAQPLYVDGVNIPMLSTLTIRRQPLHSGASIIRIPPQGSCPCLTRT